MTRSILALLLLYATLLTACAAPQPAATSTPAGAPTTISTSAGAPLPVPPQPTSPAIAPRSATPMASATFAPIVSAPTRGATVAAPSTAPTVVGVQPTVTAATAAQSPGGPVAPGVATGVRSEARLEFVNQLASAEEVDDISLVLKRTPGIVSIAGNEIAITVVYDAGLILPNQIRATLASMGHPIKP